MLHKVFDGYWIVIKYLAIILKFTIGENRVSDGCCDERKEVALGDTVWWGGERSWAALARVRGPQGVEWSMGAVRVKVINTLK